CRQERRDEVTRQRRPDDLGAQAEDVHVVVLDALVSRVDVVADRRADTGKLGGGDGGAHTGTADEHSTVGVPALNGLADLASLLRIVDPDRVGVATHVHDGVPGKRLEYSLAQAKVSVAE